MNLTGAEAIAALRAQAQTALNPPPLAPRSGLFTRLTPDVATEILERINRDDDPDDILAFVGNFLRDRKNEPGGGWRSKRSPDLDV